MYPALGVFLLTAIAGPGLLTEAFLSGGVLSVDAVEPNQRYYARLLVSGYAYGADIEPLART